MTAQEFEDRVAKSDNPAALCRGVTERLSADRNVTDKTVLLCVQALGANRAEADRFVDQVLPLLAGRESLRAEVLSRKASLAVGAGDFAQASAAYESAWKIIEPLKLHSDLQRQRILVGLGQSLLSQKKNKEADAIFLRAMAYPWYTVQNPEDMQQLRDQYLQAARGLISSRRGNATALREIVLVPATEKELRPLLDRAIQEAAAGGR